MVVHSRYIHGAGKPNHPSVHSSGQWISTFKSDIYQLCSSIEDSVFLT